MNGIRPDLRLQANGIPPAHFTVLSIPFSQMVGTVNLDTRQRRAAPHGDTGILAAQFCDFLPLRGIRETEIVVISTAGTELCICVSNVRSDLLGLIKVKRRSLGVHQLTGGETIVVIDAELAGKYLQFMLEHRSGSGQIEIAVIRRIKECILVRHGAVHDPKGIIIAKTIANRHGQISGIPFLTVRAESGKHQLISDDPRLVDLLVKADRPAMQVISIVILNQMIGFPVQIERAFSNPVANTSDKCPQKTSVVLIFLYRFVSQYHINRLRPFVRDNQRLNGTAIIQNGHRHSIRVFQCVRRYRFSGFGYTKVTGFILQSKVLPF